MSANPFEQLANDQLTATAKRRHQSAERRANRSVVMSEADAPMKGTAAEAARDERNAQMAGYRRHKANERDELCAGPYGREIAGLLTFLKRMSADSAGELVEMTKAPWIRRADADTRHAVLSIVADAILKLRVRNGMSPFDDAIGDEPPTAFQVIRKEMVGV